MKGKFPVKPYLYVLSVVLIPITYWHVAQKGHSQGVTIASVVITFVIMLLVIHFTLKKLQK